MGPSSRPGLRRGGRFLDAAVMNTAEVDTDMPENDVGRTRLDVPPVGRDAADLDVRAKDVQIRKPGNALPRNDHPPSGGFRAALDGPSSGYQPRLDHDAHASRRRKEYACDASAGRREAAGSRVVSSDGHVEDPRGGCKRRRHPADAHQEKERAQREAHGRSSLGSRCAGMVYKVAAVYRSVCRKHDPTVRDDLVEGGRKRFGQSSPLEHLDRGHVGRRSRFSAEEAVKPLLDSAAHRTDVVRPAQQRVTGGLEEVARVAVGNRCEDRRAGCKVFVGLSGDNAGAPSRVEIVHRQEEEVRAPHQRDRFEVRPVAVGLDIGLPDRRQVLRGQIADEVGSP